MGLGLGAAQGRPARLPAYDSPLGLSLPLCRMGLGPCSAIYHLGIPDP